MFAKDPATVDEAEEAVRLAPHDPGTLMAMGLVIGNSSGGWERDASLIDKGLRLTSNPPIWVYLVRSVASYHQGKYKEALQFAQKNTWEYIWSPLLRAAIHAELGQLEQAQVSVKRAVKMNPDIADQVWNIFGKWWLYEDVVNFVSSLRKAGLDIPDED